MSKRHQSSRRKTYGRRQHEIQERTSRRTEAPRADLVEDAEVETGYDERSFYGFGGVGSRLGLALAD